MQWNQWNADMRTLPKCQSLKKGNRIVSIVEDFGDSKKTL